MLAISRFVIMGFLALTVIYLSLWFYLRARRREFHERDWVQQGRPNERDSYVAKHMANDDLSRRRLLIPLVYGGPLCLVMIIIFLTNNG